MGPMKPTEKGEVAKKAAPQAFAAPAPANLAANEKDVKPEAVKREEEILRFWREKRIFEKSLEARKKGKQFVFYEGPPTANAAPGFHHVEARSFKDVILRYRAMAGYYVPRRAGWDTHGLPVELQVEKALGLKTKRDIEAYGIGLFNEKCRESVWTHVQDWRRLTERIGFWIDLDHPYITYERSYMETLWWIIAEWWKRKLLYQDFKVLPWCTRCGTGLSSHEVALGYKMVTDESVYVRFKIASQDPRWKNIAILAWTTTPWTLPGNVGLAVSPEMQYVRIPDPKKKGNWLVVGRENFAALLKRRVFSSDTKASVPFSGKDLVGLSYQPLFEIPELVSPESYKVRSADFVKGNEGTGVVHTAVMYGDEDYALGKKFGLPTFHTVTDDGLFVSSVGEAFAGKYVKAKETETALVRHLERAGALMKTEPYDHDYPFCWRCETPILYYARACWWVRVNAVRKDLIKNNETIHWVPDHVKHGRFGEWLKEEKDWAFSRERYWGTTLPLWRCGACGDTISVASAAELGERAMSAGNRYIVMRHGESENVVFRFTASWPEKTVARLTDRGRRDVGQAGEKLKSEKVDCIYASDLVRTKETADAVAKILGIEKISFDARLHELDAGIYNGGPVSAYRKQFNSPAERYEKPSEGGESLLDVRRRLAAFFAEMEKTHQGKTILVITHADSAWMLLATMKGEAKEEVLKQFDGFNQDYLAPAAFEAYSPRELPRNGDGETDLHRPYVDRIKIRCKCGGVKTRIAEVADVWFDSGAMPFAQFHYPFAGIDAVDGRKAFPADYISEAVDQTRGWFYTMLAVATLLKKEAPYRNVISLGHVLDKNGRKMSKSKGNIVDPWEMIGRYGADAIRWYFYTVNAPGDPKKFDEKDLLGKLRGFLGTLWNSFLLFDTYAGKKVKRRSASASKLDQWILSRLQGLIGGMTSALEAYDAVTAARLLETFAVEDFSNWYLRRSRRRFQRPETKREGKEAAGVAAEILLTLAKLAAPFVPFLAEAVYQELRPRIGCKEESVHLVSWPKKERDLAAPELEKKMKLARELAAEGLKQRAFAGVKVRQPLAELCVSGQNLRGQTELLKLIQEEVNVKKVTLAGGTNVKVKLDTKVTETLRREGIAREVVRNIQEMRRDLNLRPQQSVTVQFQGSPAVSKILAEWLKEIKRDVNAKSLIESGKRNFRVEREIPLGEETLWLGIR